MNKELAYWVAVSAIPGVGTATFNKLLKTFKSLKKFWEAPDEKIRKLKIDTKTKEAILTARNKVSPRLYLEAVYERGIKVTSLPDRDYPANLRQILDAPPVLYFKGTLKAEDDLAIGVVGTRYPTVYGKQVTESLVSDLVGHGLTIVSGLARGVDSIAHKAALSAGGRTIAVLGNGVDLIYPPENKNLAERIIQNGALVSEFPLGFPSVPANFPARNRIISGLSLGILVTEAAIDSGSLITAGCAAEQGREVFAVPGAITNKMSGGTTKLIKEGVNVAAEVGDILEAIDLKGTKGSKGPNGAKVDVAALSASDRKIFELIETENMHLDLISRKSGLTVEKVTAGLTMLELKGVVKNYGSGIWGT
ncbi:DNA-protecting protein DprA [Candidatus Curtissbacteria bacterium]|nr:DNA-protecting protein DprA [Candidatus Curtissbacteria bacterium]